MINLWGGEVGLRVDWAFVGGGAGGKGAGGDLVGYVRHDISGNWGCCENIHHR